jgi:hypothetical protein
VYDSQYVTEGPFNAALVAALWLAMAVPSLSLAAALLMGLSGLIRPLGALYLPTLVINGFGRTRNRLVWTAAVVLLVAAPSLVWALRNRSVGEGLRVSTVGDFNFLFYTVPYAMAEERGADWNAEWFHSVDAVAARLDARVATGDDVFTRVREIALEEMLRRPGAVVRVQAKALVKLAIDHSLGEAYDLWGAHYEPSGLFSRLVLREQSTDGRPGFSPSMLLPLAWLAMNVAMLGAAAIGFARSVMNRRWQFALSWGLPVLLFAFATGSVALERFRMPIMLPLCLFAGAALEGRRRES